MEMRAYKVRLYPRAEQEKSLRRTLDACRRWYNMCLEERKWAYELEKRSVGVYEQKRNVPHYRDTFRLHKVVSNNTLQTVCFDLDKAFKAFFRRVKQGEGAAGYPKFKSFDNFNSFAFPAYGAGVKIDGRRLRIFAVGRVRVRWDRPIDGRIKTVRIVCEGKKWFAVFACEVAQMDALPDTGNSIGLDVGLSHLITDSNGARIANPRWYVNTQRKLRLAARRLARAKRGSAGRKKRKAELAAIHAKIANQRKDFVEKVTTRLVDENDVIAVEALTVRNMVRNQHLSKSIADAGWGMLRSRLEVKGKTAGRRIVAVNPAYTSQTCSQCGKRHDLSLSDRWLECECGLSMDRDHNAARNILKAGLEELCVSRTA